MSNYSWVERELGVICQRDYNRLLCIWYMMPLHQLPNGIIEGCLVDPLDDNSLVKVIIASKRTSDTNDLHDWATGALNQVQSVSE